MNPKLMRSFAFVIASALILGFVFMYGTIIYRRWISSDCSKLEISPPFIYVATGLAGLIGSIVAMMFNEKLPVTQTSVQQANGNSGQVVSESGPNAALQAAAKALTPWDPNNVIQTISCLYVLGYFLTGFAAIVTWVSVDGEVIDLIKNLALITFGLLLAIARSFISFPPPQA